jgi:hypothetical protein
MTQHASQLSHGRRSRLSLAVAGAVGAVVVAGCGAAASAESGARGTGAAIVTIPSRGYSPQTLERTYGVSPLLRQGIDGRGETVVLPETFPPSAGGSRESVRT